MTTPRRERLWLDELLNIQIGTTGTMTVVDLLANLDPAKTNVTVVRQLIDLTLYPDGLGQDVDGVQQLDLGIGVVSEEAFGAGVVPDPNQETEYPRDGWLWVRRMVTTNQGGTSGAHYESRHIDDDSRSQRKVDRGVLFLAGENSVSSGVGFTCRLSGRIRTLVLL